MTLGGPNNSSRSMVMFVYDSGFQHWELGYSAAAAQVLFALMLVGVAFQMWIAKKRDAE